MLGPELRLTASGKDSLFLTVQTMLILNRSNPITSASNPLSNKYAITIFLFYQFARILPTA